MSDEPMISLPPGVEHFQLVEGVTLQCRACGTRWTLPVNADESRRCADCGGMQVAVVDVGHSGRTYSNPVRIAGGRRYRDALDHAHQDGTAFVWPPQRSL